MNKLIKVTLTTLFVANVIYATQTNKTFLAGRPTSVNLAMEGTTWHTQINKPQGNVDKFGAAIQAVGFYQENVNKNDLGKYFGFDNKRRLYIGNPETGAGTDIDKKHLLHRIQGSTSTEFTGTINLAYKHEAAGLRLDYQQDLDGLVKGLFFKVRAPIIWEEMKLSLGLQGSITATINKGDSVTSQTADVSIANYFSGNLTQTAGVGTLAQNDIGSRQQAALTHAKITNSNHSKTGLADMDILVGWNFWETKDNHTGINIGITIPTGPNPDGVFAGEAQCGNRGHWGLGLGTDAKFELLENGKHSLEFETVADWRYLFSDDEKRTLGLKNQKWGPAVVGAAGPGANIIVAIIFTFVIALRIL